MKNKKLCKKITQLFLISIILIFDLCTNVTNTKAGVMPGDVSLLYTYYQMIGVNAYNNNAPISKEQAQTLADSCKSELELALKRVSYLKYTNQGYSEEEATELANAEINTLKLTPSLAYGVLKKSLENNTKLDSTNPLYRYIRALAVQSKDELTVLNQNDNLELSTNTEFEYRYNVKFSSAGNFDIVQKFDAKIQNPNAKRVGGYKLGSNYCAIKFSTSPQYIYPFSNRINEYYINGTTDFSNNSDYNSLCRIFGSNYFYLPPFKNMYIEINSANTSVPLFETEEALDNYLKGTSEIDSATNYSDTPKVDYGEDIEKVGENLTGDETGNEFADLLNEIVDKAKALKTESPDLTDEEVVGNALKALGLNETDTETENPGENPSGTEWTGLFSWLQAILNAIKVIPEVIRSVPIIIKTAIEYASNNILEIINKIVELLTKQISHVVDILKYVKDIAEEKFPAIGVALTVITDWLNAKTQEITDIWTAVRTIAISVPAVLDDIFDNVFAMAQAIPLTLKDIFIHVKDIAITVPKILTDIWDEVLSIPNYMDILERILAAVKAIVNFWVIDVDNLKVKIAVVEKFSGFNKFENVFKLYNGLTTYAVEYPKIEIETPGIIKQFYNHPTIILLDFGDYKEYCIWARRIFSACAWFAYGYGMLKKFRPKFIINA